MDAWFKNSVTTKHNYNPEFDIFIGGVVVVIWRQDSHSGQIEAKYKENWSKHINMEYITAVREWGSDFVKLHVDSFHEDPYTAIQTPMNLLLILAIIPWGVRCWVGTIAVFDFLLGTLMLLFPKQFNLLVMVVNISCTSYTYFIHSPQFTSF